MVSKIAYQNLNWKSCTKSSFRITVLITNCLLRSRIWFYAMFLILLSEIVFFANFACDKSRWFFPSLPPKKKMFAGGKLSCLKQIVKFLRVLLKTNQNNCTFLRLLLAINRNNFWQKSIKATFASGKSRWLKKSEYIFANFVGDKFRWLQLSRLVLEINRDDCSFLRLLVVINQDECIFC